MSEESKMETAVATVESADKDFPCKCDHCPWTGTVSEARIVQGNAHCPTCGGSLAANRVADQVMDALRQCVDLDGNSDGW